MSNPRINSLSAESVEFSGLSQPVSDAVDTYIEYAGLHASANFRQRVGRIANILNAFAPKEFPKQAFDAATLQTIASRLYNPGHIVRNQAAGRAFLDYYSHPDNHNDSKNNAFVATMLGDIPHIDRSADEFESRMIAAGRGDIFDYSKPISNDDWLTLRTGPNIPEIAKASRATNVESMIARCAFQVDHVTQPIEDDSMKLFRDVQRVDSFDVPVLDALGLNAFSILASSNAGKVRAIKSGNEATLDIASRLLERVKEVSTEEIMEAIYGVQPKQHLFQVYDNSSSYGEKIVFSSTDLNEFFDVKSGSGKTPKINARFKGVGDAAMKLLRNSNYNTADSANHLMDIFGLMAILPDERSLSDLLSYTVDKIANNNNIEMKPAPSKDQNKRFYVQGSARFVRSILSKLPADIARDAQVYSEDRPENRLYQVAKFTCTITFGEIAIPVEFQFQTQADRENARFGYVSHLNHHSKDAIAGVVSEEEKSLKGIRLRMERMDKNGNIVNGQSIEHGEEFREKFYQAAGLNDDAAAL